MDSPPEDESMELLMVTDRECLGAHNTYRETTVLPNNRHFLSPLV